MFVGCFIREKVEIPAMMSYIWVEGEGAEKTIIEWSDTADHMGDNGRPIGTFGSATFAVNSPFFVARNITFKVTFLPFKYIYSIFLFIF